MYNFKTKEKGFTLIELLIVIGIIAILAAAVIITVTPGERLADARNATRDSHFTAIGQGIHLMVADDPDGISLATAVKRCSDSEENDATDFGDLEPAGGDCDLSGSLVDPLGEEDYQIRENDGRVDVCTTADESDYTCEGDYETF